MVETLPASWIAIKCPLCGEHRRYLPTKSFRAAYPTRSSGTSAAFFHVENGHLIFADALRIRSQPHPVQYRKTCVFANCWKTTTYLLSSNDSDSQSGDYEIVNRE